MYYLGVDIGGTKTAVGLINKENDLLETASVATDVKGGLGAISKNAAQLIETILDNQGLTYSDLEYIGVGCPGSIDEEEGKVLYANNLNLSDAPLRAELERYIPVPIYLENDANCAGLGEFYALKEEEVSDFFMITLGTGVGSASIVNGKLFKGFNNAAPEMGHCMIVPGGILCSCGNKGCWEMYSSGNALLAKARDVAVENPDSLMWDIAGGKLEAIDGRVPFKAAEQGDVAAKQVLDEYFYYLGIGITNIVNAFQPQILAIGGGVSEQGDVIIRAAQEAINKGSYSKNAKLTKVIKAELGNKAGIYGAAFLKR